MFKLYVESWRWCRPTEVSAETVTDAVVSFGEKVAERFDLYVGVGMGI